MSSDTTDLENDNPFADIQNNTTSNTSPTANATTPSTSTSLSTSTTSPISPSTADPDKKRKSTAQSDPWASHNTEDNREPDWLDNWSTEKLLAMAHSQIANQGGNWPHTMRRLIDPRRAIPKENSFGRPLTKKLVRNKLKRHYSSILRQLMPPLPQGEWDRLKDLANGRASGPYDMKMPPRRPVAQPVFLTKNDSYKLFKYSGQPEEESWVKYALKPVRQIERGNSRTMKSLTGELDRDPRGQGRPIGARRTLGARKLRRGIYGHLFEMCSTMTQNPRTGKWNVTWGSRELEVSRPTTPAALGFFQGVGKDGKPLNADADADADRGPRRREWDERDQRVGG
ncbi:hypothetical protein SLS62_008779 [Diatrype stigma]|uniref:Uncharacterized protein n=1 Tax=Diatrype stigma TaxID=117547 RepID=A0AAN9UIT6_9PEZI